MRLSRRISLLIVASLSGAVFLLAATLPAADQWTGVTGEFAAKILAHTQSRRAIAMSIRNISSLGEDDVAQIRRELRAQMRSRAVRLTSNRQAGIEVRVTLSENAGGYIWVADIQNGSSHDVAMMSVARSPKAEFHPFAEPLSIRKTLFYEQAEPILDVVPLERPASAPEGAGNMALVLGLDSVSLYEGADPSAKNGPAWRLKQSAQVPALRPRNRDARGRLVVGQNISFNVYLPGEMCGGTLDPALKLDCQESDAPWPLVISSAPGTAAYFNADRNFFDGRFQFEDGRAMMASPFYSAAVLPSKSGAAWLLAGLDGRVQMFNSNLDSMGSFEGWGSNITVIQSGCLEGWQAIATKSGDFSNPDEVQAIDVASRKAVPASTPVNFAGPVMELWPLADGSAAIAISQNLKTSGYEAFRISITCGQ